jgi:hypothetical protein
MARATVLDKSAQLVENNGDVVLVRNGDIDDFHIISPDGDVEVMRQVGALSEMLFERAKNAFGARMVLVVVESYPSRLVVFPREGRVAVWKTTVGTGEILQAVHPRDRAVRREKQLRRHTHP